MMPLGFAPTTTTWLYYDHHDHDLQVTVLYLLYQLSLLFPFLRSIVFFKIVERIGMESMKLEQKQSYKIMCYKLALFQVYLSSTTNWNTFKFWGFQSTNTLLHPVFQYKSILVFLSSEKKLSPVIRWYLVSSHRVCITVKVSYHWADRSHQTT